MVLRILGIDAALDGGTAPGDIALGEGQRLARGDAELQMHQVQTGDQFGDRVLHLQPRVHLEEVEVAVRIHQELGRARVGITGRARHAKAACAHGSRISGCCATSGEGHSSTTF